MPSNLNLDYYYGNEAEQYSFYRIPKTLLTDPRYKSVSIEAKVLYGLLLDRMGLSVKNGWMDSDKRVYIYFTQEDAMNLMSCGKDKATKLFRELDKDGMNGKLPDHIFSMFIADYDAERAGLRSSISDMEKALEKVRDAKSDIDRFAALIKKYTSFEELDRFMLNELIDRITIYETPGMGRNRIGKEKTITIYYKFVGAIQ